MSTPSFLSTKKKNLIIKRSGSGNYVDGRYVEATPTTSTIQANVQPGLKFNDLQHIPEGQRGRKAIRIYSASEIRTRDEKPSGGHSADVVTWNGEDYEVVFAHNYQMGVLDHWKAIAVRIEVT